MHDPLSRAPPRTIGRAAIVLTVVAVVAGCGGSGRPPGGHHERIAFDASSCAPGWSAPAPGVYDFSVVNRSGASGSATLVTFGSGITLGAASNVGPHGSGTVSVRLRAGADYQWKCAVSGSGSLASAVGAVRDPLTETTSTIHIPAALSTVQLIEPLSLYRLHIDALLRTVRARLTALRAQIAAGDLGAARSAWRSAHLEWLEIGQDDGAYGAFGALGGQIDGLAAGHAGTTASPAFTGFHRVEDDLFRRDDLTAAEHDARVTAGLIARLTPAAVAADLPARTAAVDAWVLRCHEILEDALRDTLSGDDDYGSHSTLASVTADVAATREVLDVLADLISPRAPQLVSTGASELRAIDAAIDATRRRGRSWPALSSLSRGARQRIDGAVGAALETLAPVSELLQAQGADS